MKKTSYAIFAALLSVLLLLTTACGAKDGQTDDDITKKRKTTTAQVTTEVSPIGTTGTADVTTDGQGTQDTRDAVKVLLDAVAKMRTTTSFCEKSTEKTEYKIENDIINSTVRSETLFRTVGDKVEFSRKSVFEGAFDAGELNIYYKDGVEYFDYGEIKLRQTVSLEELTADGIILNNFPAYTSFFGRITAVANGSAYTITASKPSELGKSYFAKLFGSGDEEEADVTLSDMTAVFEIDGNGYIVKITMSADLNDSTLEMDYKTVLTYEYSDIDKIEKIDFPDLGKFKEADFDDEEEWG